MTTVDLVIVGLGPAGLGAALRWAELGAPGRLLAVDSGLSTDQKDCTIQQGRGCRMAEPCATVSGIGGSGMLAGGKLSVLPAGRGLQHIAGSPTFAEEALADAFTALTEFVRVIPPRSDTKQVDAEKRWYRKRGFEYRYYDAYKYSAAAMAAGYGRMANKIRSAGASIALGTEVTSIQSASDNRGFLIDIREETRSDRIYAKQVILACGRLGDRLLRGLNLPGVEVVMPSRVDAGVRLEFPSSAWPNLDACHNDLKLLFGDARTFCASKDGWVTPYRSSDIFLVEGRTDSAEKSGLSNIAVTVRLNTGASGVYDRVRAALLKETRGCPLRQPLSEFLGNESAGDIWRHRDAPPASFTYWRLGDARGLWSGDHATRIRRAVSQFVDLLMPADNRSLISIFGPELDYYWRYVEATVGGGTDRPGIFVAGDATGRFRGILQAFSSGRISADAALRNGAPGA